MSFKYDVYTFIVRILGYLKIIVRFPNLFIFLSSVVYFLNSITQKEPGLRCTRVISKKRLDDLKASVFFPGKFPIARFTAIKTLLAAGIILDVNQTKNRMVLRRVTGIAKRYSDRLDRWEFPEGIPTRMSRRREIRDDDFGHDDDRTAPYYSCRYTILVTRSNVSSSVRRTAPDDRVTTYGAGA